MASSEEERAQRYRDIALRMRDLAQSAKDAEIRSGFLILAEGYERLAAKIEHDPLTAGPYLSDLDTPTTDQPTH